MVLDLKFVVELDLLIVGLGDELILVEFRAAFVGALLLGQRFFSGQFFFSICLSMTTLILQS